MIKCAWIALIFYVVISTFKSPPYSEFYAKHHHFHLDNEIIRHKHEDFINDVLQKYRSYLIQCEICWTENCSEVLDLLEDFLNYKKHFLKSFEYSLCKMGHERVQNAVDEIMQQLNVLKTSTQANVKRMYEKLKVCYGHTSNKVLLDDLEMEHKRFVLENKKKFRNISDPYMERLRTINEDLINTYKENNAKLSVMLEDRRLSDMMYLLGMQLSKKLDLMQELTNIGCDDDSHSPLVPKRTTLDQNISKQVVTYMGNKSTTRLNLNRFDDSIISSTISSDSNFENTDFAYELKVNYEINSRKVTSFIEECLINYIEECNEIWTNEITNIKNLYKVRYDKTDIF